MKDFKGGIVCSWRNNCKNHSLYDPSWEVSSVYMFHVNIKKLFRIGRSKVIECSQHFQARELTKSIHISTPDGSNGEATSSREKDSVSGWNMLSGALTLWLAERSISRASLHKPFNCFRREGENCKLLRDSMRNHWLKKRLNTLGNKALKAHMAFGSHIRIFKE